MGPKCGSLGFRFQGLGLAKKGFRARGPSASHFELPLNREPCSWQKNPRGNCGVPKLMESLACRALRVAQEVFHINGHNYHDLGEYLKLS